MEASHWPFWVKADTSVGSELFQIFIRACVYHQGEAGGFGWQSVWFYVVWAGFFTWSRGNRCAFPQRSRDRLGFHRTNPNSWTTGAKRQKTTMFNDIDSLRENNLLKCFLFSYFLWFSYVLRDYFIKINNCRSVFLDVIFHGTAVYDVTLALMIELPCWAWKSY